MPYGLMQAAITTIDAAADAALTYLPPTATFHVLVASAYLLTPPHSATLHFAIAGLYAAYGMASPHHRR